MTDHITRSVRGSYDQIADEYARRIFDELCNKPLDRELLNRFIAEVSGRGDVCDMGCGPGQVARYLRDKGANVFGLDLSPRMLEQARQLNPDIQFREGNMMALDLKDGSLAAITAFYAIVNLPKWSLPLVFRELERVLQPGGLLLLAFHTGNEVLHEDELWGRSICMDFFLFQPPEIQRLRGLLSRRRSSASPTLRRWSTKVAGRTFLPANRVSQEKRRRYQLLSTPRRNPPRHL